ncbi:ATP-dependent DNA helicase RecG [Candidatus Microgenomates bacterium]|jgi:ATP-dependent DNA helicase RecG|nr:MAG: ATP-dependent DNA helicase RecG [Candidatus Microgenomates bacterium]
MNIKDPVEKLPLVGPTFAKRLGKLKIESIEDLINHLPFRYDDFSLISPIGKVQPGETVTVKGTIEQISNEYTKNGKKIQKAVISDSSGKIEVIWFNQPFLARTIKKGSLYNLSGKIEWFGRQKVLLSPEYEQLRGETGIHTGRLVPVYPETYGISSKWLRSRIKTALEYFKDSVEEFLPPDLVSKEGLLSEKEAVSEIHFPKNKESALKARHRLCFDELFLIQLAALLRKKEWQEKTVGKAFIIDEEKINDFILSLPFKLTSAQERVVGEILKDLRKAQPMNRLLQGDVGSGKTVVAAVAVLAAYLNGYSSLIMAPTEILANQHFKTLSQYLKPLGIEVRLVTGSRKMKAAGENPEVVVGTHSLLFQDFDPKKIGLVVIDEQHRFGVEQRSVLAGKGVSPHFLTMTATPIPRTIALTLFGDLDLSVIDELPLGRIKVKTWVVPKQKRQDAYSWIKKRVKDTKEQAFIICPLIEESESLASVKAVNKEYEILSKEVFPDLKIGLLHGRIKPKEKEEVLTKFREGEYDLLLSTPVVEVGIDIPNATIMLIEAAERFGLAQLHQLRGRVGRNNMESFCLLFTENEVLPVLRRLKTMEQTNIGMELAEIDLKLRGPGEVYGTRQHGFPDLKVASFADFGLIEKTRKAAEEVALKKLEPPLQSRLKNYKIDSVTN